MRCLTHTAIYLYIYACSYYYVYLLQVDVRDEPAELAGPRMMNFLQVLKFPIPSDKKGNEATLTGLLRGDRNVIYPVLNYVLAKFSALKKRAYVARYLLPLDIPNEFQHDEVIQELLEQYRELQIQFKDTHKALDKATSGK